MAVARLGAVSRTLAKAELSLAAVLAAAVTVLVLVNVVTRTAGVAIFWIDEAAIYGMIWMTFFATSAAFASRSAISVTLIFELVPERAARAVRTFVDLSILVFAIAMGVLTVYWFDPIGMIAAGFDVAAFQSATFNFIYSERTSTLGINKAWIWSIMPVFVLTTTIHALANLLSSAGGGAELLQ